MLYRVIFLLGLIAALISLPLSVQAQPLQTQLMASSNNTSMSDQDFFAHGTTKLLSGDYWGAIADLNQAIRNNPNNAKAHMNHGLVRGILGDKQGAIADFSRALHLSPKLAEAYYNRGFLRSELQDYTGAVADFDQALLLRPKDADTCHCRGMVRHQLGDELGAIADLRSAAELYLQQGKTNDYQVLLNQIRTLSQTDFPFS